MGLLDLSFDGLTGLLDLNSVISQVYSTLVRRFLMVSIRNCLEFFDGFAFLDGFEFLDGFDSTASSDLSFDSFAGLLDLNSMILQVYSTSVRR